MTAIGKFCHFVGVKKKTKNFISGILYIGNSLYPFALNRVCPIKVQRVDPFVTLKKSPRNVISGIPYMQNPLYLGCVKSGMGCCVISGMGCCVISGIRYIGYSLHQVRAKKIQRGPFSNIESSSRNVISGIGYIRNSLYPVCVKSSMGCVLVEDSLAIAKKSSTRTQPIPDLSQTGYNEFRIYFYKTAEVADFRSFISCNVYRT